MLEIKYQKLQLIPLFYPPKQLMENLNQYSFFSPFLNPRCNCICSNSYSQRDYQYHESTNCYRLCTNIILAWFCICLAIFVWIRPKLFRCCVYNMICYTVDEN